MHQAWKVNCKLTESDNGVYLHEIICKVLQQFAWYDQLNIRESAWIVPLARAL